MATYTLLIPAGARPGSVDALERAIAVKNGFRVWAILFPILFALVHRLWRPFFALLAVMGALGVLGALDMVPDFTVIVLDGLIGVYAGLAAADWIVTARERNGFVSAGMVAGDSEDEALVVFAHAWLKGQVEPAFASPAAHSVAPRVPQGPVIGLFPESGGR